MAFKFPLATVLQVRETIEKKEERALQAILLEMARIKRQLEEMTDLIAKAHEARELALRHPLPGGQLQSMILEAHAAEEQRLALLGVLHTMDQRRIEQLKIYQSAHRDHETILNMFHEQRELYEQEQVRVQQRYLDDIFIARRRRA